MTSIEKLLSELGVGALAASSTPPEHAHLASENPASGATLGFVRASSLADLDAATARAAETFRAWRERPAPRRGDLVRRLGELLRAHKQTLGALVSLEVGKIKSEGLGEVAEMIDICDFAVGLSRQLHGLTIASERPNHRMFEQWHPAGPLAIITAFNFPVAVWAWNAALAAVCGDPCVWKPSPLAPLTAAAVQALCDRAMRDEGAEGVFQTVFGGADLGQKMVDDPRNAIVSFTGSIEVGRAVGARVASRFGKSILELGGNNGVIVLDDANLELAVRALVFGAVGTAGQRCTTTRRLFVQRGVAGPLLERLVRAYKSVKVGDPLDPTVLLGPLISREAVARFERAIAAAREQGGEVLTGGKAIAGPGHYVEPTIVRATKHDAFPIAWEETFAPILYVFEVADLDEAIAAHNSVTQGLSSAIFTDSLRSAERFLSAAGSDCGIANVNLGTSGAEIGGAFGGEKATGGGRESGSDAWKGYMRRQTSTINFGSSLPLAQGVEFDVAG
ncbi:MAG: aldehyde dehydrogenase family protein [Polyangiaceae bacterium]